MNSLDSHGNTLAKQSTVLSQRTHCDLCNDTLLRHVRQQELYWFCPTCRHDASPAPIHPTLSSGLPPLKTAFSRKLSVVKSRRATTQKTTNTQKATKQAAKKAAKQTAQQTAQGSVKGAVQKAVKTESTAPAA